MNRRTAAIPSPISAGSNRRTARSFPRSKSKRKATNGSTRIPKRRPTSASRSARPSKSTSLHLLVVRELHVSLKVKQSETISENLSYLRLAIIAETKLFLRGLRPGATDDQLQTIIGRIREKEHELLRQEGAVLDPE